jgi:hypothetical protein
MRIWRLEGKALGRNGIAGEGRRDIENWTGRHTEWGIGDACEREGEVLWRRRCGPWRRGKRELGEEEVWKGWRFGMRR